MGASESQPAVTRRHYESFAEFERWHPTHTLERFGFSPYDALMLRNLQYLEYLNSCVAKESVPFDAWPIAGSSAMVH